MHVLPEESWLVSIKNTIPIPGFNKRTENPINLPCSHIDLNDIVHGILAEQLHIMCKRSTEEGPADTVDGTRIVNHRQLQQTSSGS